MFCLVAGCDFVLGLQRLVDFVDRIFSNVTLTARWIA